jgi:predicted nucleic acid-binding protein
LPDYEDNLIASLVKDAAVDAIILVTSDHHLLDLGPNWNGRLVMRPHDFVRRVVSR